MKPRAAILAILLVGSIVGLATPNAAATETTHSFQLEKGDWIALRYNLTGDSDLRLQGTWEGCRNSTAGQETVIGVAMFVIPDRGLPEPELVAPGASAWGLGSDMVRVNVAGSKVEAPQSPFEVSCDSAGILTGPHGYSASTSFTYILVNMAPAASVTITASYTTNVASSDSHQGTGMVRTKNDFTSGVHANYYPVPIGLSAGVGMTMNLNTSTDVVGWFWPSDSAALGQTAWSCEQNGDPCSAPRPSGLIVLESTGQVSHGFAIHAEGRVAENPYYALGIVQLPDDSYL